MKATSKTLRDSAAMRWAMLVMISALIFATYWFQDFFGGLKGLMESEMGFSSEQFGRIIGLTTIANMVGMIIVGGVVLDKWGIRVAGLAFGGLAVLGGIISAAAKSCSFWPTPVESTCVSFVVDISQMLNCANRTRSF